jgi:hypothetical protein
MSRDAAGNPMPRGLGSLLLLLVVFSCTSGMSYYDRASVVPETVVRELGPCERAEEQRRSLSHVFWRDNPMPPTPSARELRRVAHDLAAAPQVEVEELEELYGNDIELIAFALRDSDRDGVLDFRISHYRGKFFEGDLDLDNDGIRNVYDVAPYHRRIGGVDTNADGIPDKPGSFADADADGIPDHIDWTGRSAEPLADLQAGLFRDFGVILVERSSSFTPELAQAVDDTLRLVFREPIATLRTIATEEQLLIEPDLGDNGLMVAQTQTLTIYTKSIAEAKPLAVFGLLVHEVAHAWQLAQDYDSEDLRGENKRIYYPPGRFTRSLERFGWTVDQNTLGEESYHHRLYWPHFYSTSPRYLYRGSAPNEWRAWFEDVEAESGADFLRTSPAVTWGMVGPYSLTSPWEWHADQLMASVYNRMDRAVSQHPNGAYRTVATLLRARMLQVVRDQWYRYDYRNAVGTSIDRELAKQFPLSDADIELLVDRYVIPLTDIAMLSKVLALDAETIGADKLRESLVSGWDDLSDRVAEPLATRPNLQALIELGVGPWRIDVHRPTAGGDDTREGEDVDPSAPTAAAGQPGDAEATTVEPEATPPAVGEAEQVVPPQDTRHMAGRVGGTPIEAIELPEGPARKLVDPVLTLLEQLHRESAEPDGDADAPAAEVAAGPSGE